ncbi:helix-turn-helix transcriptional regulator [Lachnospiraceae bacterium MD308]|nr:helix-turn-helix transcriptional regulator [Lachnospiraceae bacterium MD308]
MNEELRKIQKNMEKLHQEVSQTLIPLYSGIELCYLTFSTDSFSVQHKAISHMIQINYCKSGQLMWEMKNGNRIYLNPGDFSLHTMKACADSVLTFPNNMYQGLSIYIDLPKASETPPDLLKNSNIFETILPKKFCQNDSPAFLAGNEQTESIFSAFYDQPETLMPPYQKIKVLELLLYLTKMEFTPQNKLVEYQFELTETIRKIHDRLLRHMEQRITIEELSRQYLINPTTLKNAFKSVYGTSVAAHIKEHRMRLAARMLIESNMNIAEIAQAVGYDSQSKFTTAFKAYFKVLPREYRKNKTKQNI